ncbi:MAG TPA: hypothetical protein VD735_05165 [Candidatus Saccharimonadales bacterium]|nr:hypothetical protein [Candidatus Saccharimonadales bacterium]
MARVDITHIKQALCLAIVAACMLSVISPAVAGAQNQRLTNRDRSVTNSEVGQALRNTSGVLQSSTGTKVSTDSDSAIVAATAGATIDVPKDADKGVTIKNKDGSSLAVSLPGAAEAADAQKVTNGVVSYPSDAGVANAVQATDDGGVRMLTVIDSPSAPTRYDYHVSVPAGGAVRLARQGGAEVVNARNEVIAVVASPWAKDARGNHIKTWFATNGTTLTQYVKHNVAGVVYPVTADPFWLAIAPGIFWWAVQRCGATGSLSLVASYLNGDRSPRAMAVAGIAGCLGGFVGGTGKLKNIMRVIRW